MMKKSGKRRVQNFRLVVSLSLELHMFFLHVSMHPRTFWPLKVKTPHWESKFRSMQLLITKGSLVSSVDTHFCHQEFHTFTHCLKVTQNVAFEFWHFPPNFVLLKLTCLVTLFDSKLQVFKKLAKMDHFWHF